MPIETLSLGDKEVIIVGTAHVSERSVEAVEAAIREHKPDAVAVELCEQRYSALKEEKRWDETEITKVLTSDRIYLFLLQILLGNFQRRIGDDLGIKPGSEMMKAVDVAEELGIEVVLADRDVRLTLKRAMSQMTFKEKAKVAWGFLGGFIGGEEIDEELVERLKEKDVLTELMEELAVETPSIKRVLVDERDSYIAHAIHACPAKKIVAVVGAGHMKGIVENLKALQGEVLVRYSHSMDDVHIGPAVSKKKINLIAWGIPALFVVLLIWGFVSNGSQMTQDMIIQWVLVNGTLSALGVALALGHPASIIAAFIAAPITSLNPTVAAGWVAGYVELQVRKPRVVDFKNLLKLKSMGDYLGNRVVRVILIVAFANIGSTLGTLIGFGLMARIAELI